ncbi:hypothetical protein [Glaciibacter psychrotolerans]|uniref:Chorismate-pyruvate lyase n=1 Tax=Glaciibacter psychrotolerans TaxID=670054 RepID=A0A7Z0J540_9MICO|nr:hypothetical protein [Leifsonia psychrotolerans]NYJ18488.1 chorismate-pyruvate lyase [Leifsonia psychrotolerans]
MNDFELDVAPAGLSDAARAAWCREPMSLPQLGEIWLLSWNGHAHALVLVTALSPDYVLGMPVMLGAGHATEDEMLLPASVLGTELTLLHRAETGLGRFLFHRNLGVALSESDTARVRNAAYSTEQPPLRVGTQAFAREVGEVLDSALRKFQSLCFIEWPSVEMGEAVLNRSALEQIGVNAREFRTVSDLPTSVALRTWRGDEPLGEAVLNKLSAHFKVAREELVSAPDDTNTHELSEPRFKSDLLELASNLSMTEREARNRVRGEFALAARSNSLGELRKTLVEDTVIRLLEASRDGD